MTVTTRSSLWGPWTAAVLLTAVAIARGADTDSTARQQASRILQATGVEGGLVVHLGCGDGRLTAALHAGDAHLVHGLDTDPGNVRQARQHVRSLGIYGRVSVDTFDGRRLPYAENLVRLLVADGLGNVPMDEVMRVLAPRGVAYVREAGTWRKTVKPWPDEMDEWTHWLHGADGNAVARDRLVAPLGRVQWAAAPLWQRHHDTVPSTSAMVSARGRLFYIADEAPACLDGSMPDQWFLVARDAFSGVLLWKRPMPQWGWSEWAAEWLGRFNIPPQLPKRLVADGDRVFATLGFNAPLTALDAATGRTLREYEGTERTDEILVHEGLLILAINQETRKPSKDDLRPVRKSVAAVDPDSGRALWKTGDYQGLKAKFSSAEPFGRLELAAGGGAVYLVDQDALVSLDVKTGRERWRAPRPEFREHTVGYGIRMSDQCVLVYQDGVVLFAQPEMKRKRSWHTLPGTLHAFSSDDGRPLWKHRYGGWSHNWQPDVFVIDGLVWLHEHVEVDFKGHEPRDKSDIDYAVIGLDLTTGALRRRFSTQKTFDVGHHHRCYRGKATERFLLASRRGVEFLDLQTERNHLYHWARAACLHGFVPCNGMIYLSPHPCSCYIATKLNGYYALAGGTGSLHAGEGADRGGRATPGTRLGRVAREKGPAYGQSQASTEDAPTPHDWPTFRRDPARSGSTEVEVPRDLGALWKASPGGRLSPPVGAGGKVFLASIDRHEVIALDGATGTKVWSFTAGARVDTPPTIHEGLALFGAADGHVYCVVASDGRLVWRRRLAPESRLIGAFNQLESAWPVHGSVLVQDGVAYAAAGRSSYLDGGIVVAGLDPRTGELLEHKVLYSPDPATGDMPPGDARTIPGTLADILCGDGSTVRMLGQPVFGQDGGKRPHLQSTALLRDGAWFNRTQWSVGRSARGQLLVFNDQVACALAAYTGSGRSGFFRPGDQGYLLLATPLKTSGGQKQPRWSTRIPVRGTAMVLAGQTLLVAGPPDVVDPDDPLAAFEGRKGGRLWAVRASGGEKLLESQLDAPPVHDGMAVAAGKVLIALESGEVLCLGSGGGGR